MTDSGGLIPYDPIKQTLVPTPDLYLSDGVNTLVPIRLGMGVIGQVAQKRKPELVNDMENDPRRQYLDTRSRSELAVPGRVDFSAAQVNKDIDRDKILSACSTSRAASLARMMTSTCACCRCWPTRPPW